MRVLAAGMAAVMAMLAVGVQASNAERTPRPWCIRDGAGGRGMWDCSYQTQQQCQASASGAGGTCWENPKYTGPKKKATAPPPSLPGGY